MLLLAVVSCKRNNDQVTGYSDKFKQIQIRAEKLFTDKKPAEALRVLDSAVSRGNLTLEDKFRAYGLHYAYYQRGARNSKRALQYADTMLVLARQSLNKRQYEKLYVDANFALGDANFTLQKYSEAYQHLYQGYITGKNNLDKVVLSDYMYRMGMISYKMADYKLATDYFKKSYSNYIIAPTDFVNFYHVQELLDNIALSYKHNNQPDSAIVYFDRSLKFINQYGPYFKDKPRMMEIAQGVVYGNKAEVLITKGDYKQAIELLKKSIRINLQKDYDNNDAELSEIKLAKIYDEHNQDKDLLDLLTAIKAQLVTVKNANVEADWNELISRYYLRKNNLPLALSHLQTYNTLKDSNVRKLNLLRESDISKQLDSYEKQQEIEQLSSNNKIQLISLYVIIAFAVMALIIISLVYRNWRRSKKDVQTVNVLNSQINQQNSNLESALAELELNSQEKDRILRTVAHDLRNPIGGIASLTNLMADDDYTDDQKELIDLVKQASHNSLALIEEILEATNINSTDLNVEQVDINSLVSNSVELLKFKAAEKGQKIIFKPLSHPQNLYISREKIWRVISNLISNAIKFSPGGASIVARVEKTDQDIIIAVMDNGIGIPDKLKDKVFNMFTAAQRPGTAGEKSFGLGLSICKQIIEKSHGRIWFESNGKGTAGTTFFISLPLSLQGDAVTESPEQAGVPQT